LQLHRSRARNVLERFRKARSMKRLYRCDGCGWRGWLLPLEQALALEASGVRADGIGPDAADLQSILASAERV
jgi:hypothetical protein